MLFSVETYFWLFHFWHSFSCLCHFLLFRGLWMNHFFYQTFMTSEFTSLNQPAHISCLVSNMTERSINRQLNHLMHHTSTVRLYVYNPEMILDVQISSHLTDMLCKKLVSRPTIQSHWFCRHLAVEFNTVPYNTAEMNHGSVQRGSKISMSLPSNGILAHFNEIILLILCFSLRLLLQNCRRNRIATSINL